MKGRTADEPCDRPAKGEKISATATYVAGDVQIPSQATKDFNVTKENLVIYLEQYSPAYVDDKAAFAGMPKEFLPPGGREVSREITFRRNRQVQTGLIFNVMADLKHLQYALAKTERVALSLEHDIRSGKLGYGDQLESEKALVRRFDVSRSTVRKGLEVLVDKGLIMTRVGIGSFVTFNGKTIDDSLGWTRALAHQQEAVETRLLRLCRISDTGLAAELNLRCPDFIAIDRVREISNTRRVVSIERSRVPFRPELDRILTGGLLNGSLSATLSAVGLKAESGEEWAEVECLDATNARLAGTTVGTPFLRTRRLVRGAGDDVIEYVVSHLDPRYFALHLAF